MATTTVLKARLPLFLFLGSLFLAMACVSVALKDDAHRQPACRARCKLITEKQPQRAKKPREEEQHAPQEQPQLPQERERERRQQEERRRQEEREQQQQPPRREEERRQPQEERRPQEEKEQQQQQPPRLEEERRQPREERRLEKEEQEKEREEGQGSQSRNPYLFRFNSFRTRFQNERGHIQVLQRFDQRSHHLRWLKNYRYVEFELQPESLVIPHHHDAEIAIIAHKGRAIISIVNQTDRESYNLEKGDVLWIPAGSLAYTANVDENESFRAANLVFPVNIPGQYENFYPSGNQNPQSYYNAFSKKTLEVSFNANYDEIRRILLRQQKQQEQGQKQKQSSEAGVFVKLSKEHIRKLRRQAKTRPRGGRSSSSGPLNLRNLKPLYSNNYGNFWEARPQDYRPFRDLDISAFFLDLNKGSLFLPHYNSKAIIIAQVVDGQAQLEIASPHLANQRSESEQEQAQEEQDEQEQRERQIQGVSSNLRQGDVFVILAGHPVALRASQESHLRLVGFSLNAENNQRNFLAGERDNVINQIEKIIKELAFLGDGDDVDVEKLLRNQKESYFVNAQRQQGGQEEKAPLSSILGAFF